MIDLNVRRLFIVVALAAMPLVARAKADACKGKSEGDGEGKGVVLGARKVKVEVAEISTRKPAKLTLVNNVGDSEQDLIAARKGSEWSYQGPVQLHLCSREFHAPANCYNKVSYRPGIVQLETKSGYRVKLKVSCK